MASWPADGTPNWGPPLKAYVDDEVATRVPATRTVAGKSLSANVTLAKGDVGLGNVDNTSDASKPVSTAQQSAINARVPATRQVAGKALSADVTLTKGDVGLGNVDNTSDANKPISTATQAALTALGVPVRVYQTFADAPALPVDTVVISRSGA